MKLIIFFQQRTSEIICSEFIFAIIIEEAANLDLVVE